MTHRLLIGMAIFCLAGSADCQQPQSSKAPQQKPADEKPTLKVFGALRAMFHEGQTSETVNLASLLPNQHLYAVGAISKLRGEVTIVGGKTYLSYPANSGSVRTKATDSSNESATLLVATEIANWKSVVTTQKIQFGDIDNQIEKLAEQVGIDSERPFAFLIRGQLSDLQWHIIDGRRLKDGGGSHEDHLKASIQKSRNQTQGTLIGFFSPHHQGVFTHMGSKTHIHCVVQAPLSSGHVDRVVIPAGTAIKFSKNLQPAP